MSEQYHRERVKPLPELQKSVTEILVANGRSFQPFIRTFSYTGENVSKSNLGTLVGIFEVDEKSDDSAYIVNFLASVAKKEYFNNPRRGAVESFESALHKINLALAELVKHGNVAWLGKLHGALGVLEKNNLHFSVTGKAKILLLRNGNLADIGEGLASEESHTHPIKTFVEVSSGRLLALDKVLLTSPELFSLFSFEDLEKNASRMSAEHFSQFLKTALRNELDISGTLIIDFKVASPKTVEKPEKKKVAGEGTTPVNNVFSQSAFSGRQKVAVPLPKEDDELTAQEPVREEYVDSKTGHIYVQGETPESSEQSPFMEQTKLLSQEIAHSIGLFFTLQGKWARKLKKQSIIAWDVIREEGKTAAIKTLRSVRKQWKKGVAAIKSRQDQSSLSEDHPILTAKIEEIEGEPVKDEKILVSDIPLPQEILPQREIVNEEFSLDSKEETSFEGEIPSFMKEKLALFYKRGSAQETEEPALILQTPITSLSLKERFFAFSLPFLRNITSWGQKIIHLLISFFRLFIQISGTIGNNCKSFYQRLLPLHKKILFGTLFAILAIVSGTTYFLKEEVLKQENTTSQTPQEEETFPSSIGNEKNALVSEEPVIIATTNNSLITSVLLGSDVYLITEKNITHVREGKSYPIPNNDRVRFAAVMDDLRLIFIATKNGKLYAWSPISSTFTENTLSLPQGATVDALDTYLTYLYVLDSTNDQIFRFPRAEGGFGQGSPWLKENVALENGSKMAVNETIFIAKETSSVQGFFRGRLARTLESPNTELGVTSLYTHPGLANIYVLDRPHKRVVVWNQDGALIAQYFHDKMGEAKTISVNEKTGEMFLSTDSNTLLSFKLKQ